MFQPGKENLTSSGKTKATPGDALRSYQDFLILKDYFLNPAKRVYGIRNYALLVIGIATGLRISDLTSLKLGNLITSDADGNPIFLDEIDINEIKTGKRTKTRNDTILITEAIQDSVSLLLTAYANTSSRSTKIKKTLTLDDWLFQSSKPSTKEFVKGKGGQSIKNPKFGQYVLEEESAHKIFKDAQRELKLDYDLCTRTTRKTFACLHLMFSRMITTGSTAGAELTQLATRHSSIHKLMHYLSITRSHSEAVRRMISDWIMGKSEFGEIKL